jgi:hypothetical protein
VPSVRTGWDTAHPTAVELHTEAVVASCRVAASDLAEEPAADEAVAWAAAWAFPADCKKKHLRHSSSTATFVLCYFLDSFNKA